jgi:trans-aconitate methyltransferase
MSEEKDYLWWTLPEVAAEHDDMNRSYFEKGEAGKYPYFDVLQQAMRLIEQKDGRSRPMTCLDVGCGAGWQAVYLASLGLDGKFLYEGMDISAHMCERAKRNYPAGCFYVADIMEFKPGRQWDVVMACGSIEHFSDWKEFLARLAALSDGWIVVHKVFFHDGLDKPTEKTTCPTYAGKTQTRMVLEYTDFTQALSDLGYGVEKRFDWDVGAVSCVVARRKIALCY